MLEGHLPDVAFVVACDGHFPLQPLGLAHAAPLGCADRVQRRSAGPRRGPTVNVGHLEQTLPGESGVLRCDVDGALDHPRATLGTNVLACVAVVLAIGDQVFRERHLAIGQLRVLPLGRSLLRRLGLLRRHRRPLAPRVVLHLCGLRPIGRAGRARRHRHGPRQQSALAAPLGHARALELAQLCSASAARPASLCLVALQLPS